MRPLVPSLIALLTCTGLLSLGGAAYAQVESTDAERLLKSDPQQLLDLSQDHGNSIVLTSIAGFGKRDVRGVPANVQVITAREIQASGAKDLYDALQLVPGLSFGREADDKLGVGIHGNWAAEGKCLFLLDGVELNANDLGGYSIDQRIALANVDRIEVLMGPGSLMHGGYATLGVINIVSRSADQGTGARASVQSGYSNQNITSSMENVSGSHRLSRDQDISYMATFARGQRSNALRLMPDSTWLDFADSTAMQSSSFQFSYRWRGFRASLAYMEETYALSDKPADLRSRDLLLSLEYNKKLTDKWNISWRLSHLDQLPGSHMNTLDPTLLAGNTGNQRTSIRGTLSIRPADWLSLNIGTQGYHQRSAYLLRSPKTTFNLNGEPTIAMNNGAVFGEIELIGRPGLLSAGYRIEVNDLAGGAASPRLAYAKIFGPLNVKLMWSSAFKLPTLMNLDQGPVDEPLQVEYATTKEAELGLKLAKIVSLTVNVYDTRIKQPITTVYDPATKTHYINGDAAGTTGFDARVSLNSKRTTFMAGFGANNPMSQPDLVPLEADSTNRAVISLPPKKAYAVLAWDMLSALTIRGKATWKDATRPHFNANLEPGLPEPAPWPQELIFDAGLTWRPRNSERLAIDMDCTDLTDEDRTIIGLQGNTAMPFALNGRAWSLSISYKFIR